MKTLFLAVSLMVSSFALANGSGEDQKTINPQDYNVSKPCKVTYTFNLGPNKQGTYVANNGEKIIIDESGVVSWPASVKKSLFSDIESPDACYEQRVRDNEIFMYVKRNYLYHGEVPTTEGHGVVVSFHRGYHAWADPNSYDEADGAFDTIGVDTCRVFKRSAISMIINGKQGFVGDEDGCRDDFTGSEGAMEFHRVEEEK